MGVLLAIDNLTTKSHIIFSWVCVQIKPNLPLHDEIYINLNGYKFKQQVTYDWKPQVCKSYNSLSYDVGSCPLNSKPPHASRGRIRRRQVKRFNTTISASSPRSTFSIPPLDTIMTIPLLSNPSHLVSNLIKSLFDLLDQRNLSRIFIWTWLLSPLVELQ